MCITCSLDFHLSYRLLMSRIFCNGNISITFIRPIYLYMEMAQLMNCFPWILWQFFLSIFLGLRNGEWLCSVYTLKYFDNLSYSRYFRLFFFSKVYQMIPFRYLAKLNCYLHWRQKGKTDIACWLMFWSLRNSLFYLIVTSVFQGVFFVN